VQAGGLRQGSPDPGFGQHGAAMFDPGFGSVPSATVSAEVIQPDGRIVVAGAAWNAGAPCNSKLLVARLTRKGALDPSFARKGVNKLDPFGVPCPIAQALALAHDGKILVAGVDAGGDESFVLRLLPDGRLDRSFGDRGIAFLGATSSCPGCRIAAQMNGVAVAPNGTIVASGTAKTLSSKCSDCVFLARLRSNGKADLRFGHRGHVFYNRCGPDGNTFANGFALDRSGRIDIAGFLACNHHAGAMVARFSASGSLDRSFGKGGLARMPLPNTPQNAEALALQPDGKLLAVNSLSGFRCAVIRFTAGGKPDPNFGSNGVAIPSDFQTAGEYSIAVLPNRDIVISSALHSYDQPPTDVALLTPSGSFDRGFGKKGIVTLQANYDTIAAQPNNKIVLGGTYALPPGTGPESATITRLLGPGG